MSRYRKVIVIGLAAATLLSIWVVRVAATDSFSDVADSAFYHDDVNWLVDRGVTAGCGSGLYCPNSSVTRGQMATFLANLGDALAPEWVMNTGSVGAVDVDATDGAIVCATGSTEEHVPEFEQTAEFSGDASVVPAAGSPTMGFWAYAVYSTDDGVTWDCFDNCWSSEAEATAEAQDIALPVHDVTHLTPGQDYRFAIQLLDGDNTTGNATADTQLGGWCNFEVRIDNDFVG